MSVRLFIFGAIFVSVLYLPGALCQQNKNPAIEVCFPNYSYPVSVSSLSDLDLSNREVIIFNANGTPLLHAGLRRGVYEKQNRSGGEYVRLVWTKYLKNDSRDADYAVAYYSLVLSAGSASDFGVVQLLRVEVGHLKALQQILFNTRGSERAGVSLTGKKQLLTIRGLNDWEHCCPTGLDVVTFELTDGLLKQINYRKAPLE